MSDKIAFSDEVLIECIRQRPSLWQVTHPEYRNSVAKEKCWVEIAAKFKERIVSAEVLKLRWKHIKNERRNAVVKAKTASGQAAKQVRPYRYAQSMAFLDDDDEEEDPETNFPAPRISTGSRAPVATATCSRAPVTTATCGRAPVATTSGCARVERALTAPPRTSPAQNRASTPLADTPLAEDDIFSPSFIASQPLVTQDNTGSKNELREIRTVTSPRRSIEVLNPVEGVIGQADNRMVNEEDAAIPEVQIELEPERAQHEEPMNPQQEGQNEPDQQPEIRHNEPGRVAARNRGRRRRVNQPENDPDDAPEFPDRVAQRRQSIETGRAGRRQVEVQGHRRRFQPMTPFEQAIVQELERTSAALAAEETDVNSLFLRSLLPMLRAMPLRVAAETRAEMLRCVQGAFLANQDH